jgi:hypothetical protein
LAVVTVVVVVIVAIVIVAVVIIFFGAFLFCRHVSRPISTNMIRLLGIKTEVERKQSLSCGTLGRREGASGEVATEAYSYEQKNVVTGVLAQWDVE